MMPTASHLRNFKQTLGTYRRVLEEFESALLEFEETPVCEVCGEALRDTRRDAKTCSAACRQKAYRRRVHHLPPYRAGAERVSENTSLLDSSVNRGNGAALSGEIRAEGEGFEPSRANAHPQLGHLQAPVRLSGERSGNYQITSAMPEAVTLKTP
jgi:hypothetical protein